MDAPTFEDFRKEVLRLMDKSTYTGDAYIILKGPETSRLVTVRENGNSYCSFGNWKDPDVFRAAKTYKITEEGDLQGRPELFSFTKSGNFPYWKDYEVLQEGSKLWKAVESRLSKKEKRRANNLTLFQANYLFVKTLCNKIGSSYPIPESIPGQPFKVKGWGYIQTRQVMELSLEIALGVDSLVVLEKAIQATGEELDRVTGPLSVKSGPRTKLILFFSLQEPATST